MTTYAITERGTGQLLMLLQASSVARALEQAVRRGGGGIPGADLAGLDLTSAFLYRGDFRGASFAGADLRGAFLREADLRDCDFRHARLNQAFLKGADLRGANLQHADFSRADLRAARLCGAYLHGARCDHAQLQDTVLDWRLPELPAELLRRESTLDHGCSLIVDLLFHDDGQPFTWLKRLLAKGDLATRACRLLARSVRDGDNAPELLRRLYPAAGQKPKYIIDSNRQRFGVS